MIHAYRLKEEEIQDIILLIRLVFSDIESVVDLFIIILFLKIILEVFGREPFISARLYKSLLIYVVGLHLQGVDFLWYSFVALCPLHREAAFGGQQDVVLLNRLYFNFQRIDVFLNARILSTRAKCV